MPGWHELLCVAFEAKYVTERVRDKAEWELFLLFFAWVYEFWWIYDCLGRKANVWVDYIVICGSSDNICDCLSEAGSLVIILSIL